MGIRHPAGTSRRKDERADAAKELAEERAKRSPEEQLKLLDTKLGKGQGAKKERARLQKLIAKGNE